MKDFFTSKSMPEDCIFLFFLFYLGAGEGGGGGGGGSGCWCWCKSGRGHTFCAIENEGLHKILQSFLKGHVFLLHSNFHPTKEKQ